MRDYRKGQKVIFTLDIEDKGQDFIELDVLENGVILGDSVMFRNGRMSLLGIGTENGTTYYAFKELAAMKKRSLKGLSIYLKDTPKKDPLPWEASILNYKVLKVKKATKPNRFVIKK